CRLGGGDHTSLPVGVHALEHNPEGAVRLTGQSGVEGQHGVTSPVLAAYCSGTGLILPRVLGKKFGQRRHIAGGERRVPAANQSNIGMFGHDVPLNVCQCADVTWETASLTSAVRPGGDRSDIAGPTRLYPRTSRKLQGEPLSE